MFSLTMKGREVYPAFYEVKKREVPPDSCFL